MTASATNADVNRVLLASSGGKPIIHIVLDPPTDQISIRSAGIPGGTIPRFLLDLGIALTGEPPDAAGSPSGGP